MTIGVPRERVSGERRVAVAPAHVGGLEKAGLRVVVESGAGELSGFSDRMYEERGAGIVSDAYAQADVILAVRATPRTRTWSGPSGRCRGRRDPPHE